WRQHHCARLFDSVGTMLEDPDARVRRAAASVWRSPSDLWNLVANDPDIDVRQTALKQYAVSMLERDTGGSWRTAIDRIWSVLDDPDLGVVALTSLGRIGDRHAIPVAMKRLTHKS